MNEYNRPGGAETTIEELRRGLALEGIETDSYILADNTGKVVVDEISF